MNVRRARRAIPGKAGQIRTSRVTCREHGPDPLHVPDEVDDPGFGVTAVVGRGRPKPRSGTPDMEGRLPAYGHACVRIRGPLDLPRDAVGESAECG